MHHSVMYFANIDAAVLANISAVADPTVNVQGDNIRVPNVMDMVGGIHALGGNITLAQLLAPSLRTIVNIDVAPVDVANEPTSPATWTNYFDSPIQLQAGENMRFQGAEDGGTTQISGLIHLVDGPRTPVKGPIHTVRGTGATTLTIDVWSNVAVTLDQALPAGNYQLVGMRAVGATLLAARVVVPGYPWRPGCSGYDAVSDIEDPIFRNGGLGVWAPFDNVQLFSVDCLSIAADTAQTFFFDIIKTS